MCNFIRHPYSNGYSIACACWSRYAFARRERQVLVVGVGESQLSHMRVYAIAYPNVCVSVYGENARTFYARIEYVLVSGVGTAISSVDH